MTRWTRQELMRLREVQITIQEILAVVGTDRPGADALIGANEELASAERSATAELSEAGIVNDTFAGWRRNTNG